VSKTFSRCRRHRAVGYCDIRSKPTILSTAAALYRVITDDGRTYQLPTAECDKIGNFTPQQVLDAAKAAAAETGKAYSVLVTEAISRMWVGLSQVTARVQFPTLRRV